jgi:hypothetical protein
MQTHGSAWGLPLSVLLATMTGVAGAQTPQPAAGNGGSFVTQRQVSLSPQEQLAQADGFVARMSATGSTVRRKLEQARAQRDIVKVLCLNDKLNQVDVAIRSAKERRTALELAANRKDVDLASHEYAIVIILRQRVEQLGAEANLCIGFTEFFPETKTIVTVDANLPSEDSTAYPQNPIVTPPPVTASPFK